MADYNRGVSFADQEKIHRGRPQQVLTDSMQAVTREYVREANKEGKHIPLEMLCQHLEGIKSGQEFSIRTLGRALDRWGFTFGKGTRSQLAQGKRSYRCGATTLLKAKACKQKR